MEARRLLGLSLLALVLSFDASAAPIATSLFTPLPPGISFTSIDLTGIPTPSQTPFSGPGYSVSFATTPIQGVVKDNLFDFLVLLHAVPVAGVQGLNTPRYLTGGFGSALTNDLGSSGNYFSTGFLGTITITFDTPRNALALLWGSVDAGNFLTFNDAAGTVVTGADVQAGTVGFVSDGFQGPGGSAWVLITPPTPFTSVIAASNFVPFEFAAVTAAAVPEPTSFLLTGIGISLLAWRRRVNKARV